MRVFESQIVVVDQKVKKAQMDEDVTLFKGEIPQEYQEKIDVIDSEIKKLLREIEILGEKGDIEECERLTDEVTNLRKSKEDLMLVAVNPKLASKQMKLCEICGAKQTINDLEKRNQSHFEGKLHTGFALIRIEYEKLQKRLEMVKIALEVNKEESRRTGKDVEMQIDQFNHSYRNNREGERFIPRSEDQSKSVTNNQPAFNRPSNNFNSGQFRERRGLRGDGRNQDTRPRDDDKWRHDRFNQHRDTESRYRDRGDRRDNQRDFRREENRGDRRVNDRSSQMTREDSRDQRRRSRSRSFERSNRSRYPDDNKGPRNRSPYRDRPY